MQGSTTWYTRWYHESVKCTDFKIVRCHRLGRYNPNSPRTRPIIFKLQWVENREAIRAKCRELKDHPHWIQEYVPYVIVERCHVLAPIVKAAREQGKKAFLSVDHIVIDDQSYTMKTLHRLLHDLEPATLSQKSDPQRKYPTDFVDNNGKPFHCSEQKFNYDKAVEFIDM